MKNYLGDAMPVLPWMINFEKPSTSCTSRQKQAAYASNSLEYQANLDINSKCGRRVLTSFGCVIGSDNSTFESIGKMLKAGVTSVCIDLSRGNTFDQLELIDNIKKAVENYNELCGRVYPFAIALEITGLRIRTGYLENHALADCILKDNEIVHLVADDSYECYCNETTIYINSKPILKILKPKDVVYIDFGAIILEVVEIGKRNNSIKCLIRSGGKLRNKALVQFPNIPQMVDDLICTELITVGLKYEVDALIISRVRCAHIIENIRALLGEEGKATMIYAKIEDKTAIENIDSILAAADGIVVARGELGLELPSEKLFIAQKSIIAKCNKLGKPVFCGAHLLSSMSTKYLPTRAEMLDVANAVLDGTDGLLISEEIVDSPHFLNSLKLMQSICLEAEAATYQKQVFSNMTSILPLNPEPSYSVAMTATDASMKCNASCIIAQTVSGKVAKLIAYFRPPCPIIAVTRYGHVARKLNFWKAIIPVHYIGKQRGDWQKDVELRFNYAVTFGKYSGLIKAGDALILVSSWKEGSGFTNTVRIVYASQNNFPKIKKKK